MSIRRAFHVLSLLLLSACLQFASQARASTPLSPETCASLRDTKAELEGLIGFYTDLRDTIREVRRETERRYADHAALAPAFAAWGAGEFVPLNLGTGPQALDLGVVSAATYAPEYFRVFSELDTSDYAGLERLSVNLLKEAREVRRQAIRAIADGDCP